MATYDYFPKITSGLIKKTRYNHIFEFWEHIQEISNWSHKIVMGKFWLDPNKILDSYHFWDKRFEKRSETIKNSYWIAIKDKILFYSLPTKKSFFPDQTSKTSSWPNLSSFCALLFFKTYQSFLGFLKIHIIFSGKKCVPEKFLDFTRAFSAITTL